MDKKTEKNILVYDLGGGAVAHLCIPVGYLGTYYVAICSVCVYIYIIYMLPPPKIYHFQLFVDVKEVVFLGNLLQKQSKHTITFKKDEHILRSESTSFLEGSNLF